MKADGKTSVCAVRSYARRFGGMVEMLDDNRNFRDNMASGLGQPNAAMPALEQANSKVFLKRLDAHANAGLAHAKDIGIMAKVEVLGDSNGLNE